MLADPSLSLFSGALLGALLLCLGLLIGIFLGRRAQTAEMHAVSAQQLLQVLGSLNGWIARFARDVTAHRKTIDTLAQQARRVDAPHSAATAESLIDQAQAATELLQSRLAAAEKNLHDQTAQLKNYMAEARTDGLTGLPNRRALDAELGARVSRWRREAKPTTVLMIDVDHFKKLNDVYGHLAGDYVLQQVAEVLLNGNRETEFVGRYGGEEFCVLLQGVNFENAAVVAAKLRAKVAAAEFVHEGQPLKVTISCGGAMTQLGDDSASLVRRADEALYAAKQSGRNRSYWHDGRHSVPLESSADESAGQAQNSVAPSVSSLPGFENVVADLQKKLKQVAES